MCDQAPTLRQYQNHITDIYTRWARRRSKNLGKKIRYVSILLLVQFPALRKLFASCPISCVDSQSCYLYTLSRVKPKQNCLPSKTKWIKRKRYTCLKSYRLKSASKPEFAVEMDHPVSQKAVLKVWSLAQAFQISTWVLLYFEAAYCTAPPKLAGDGFGIAVMKGACHDSSFGCHERCLLEGDNDGKMLHPPWFHLQPALYSWCIQPSSES